MGTPWLLCSKEPARGAGTGAHTLMCRPSIVTALTVTLSHLR